MRRELRCLLSAPLYWFLIVGSVGLSGALALFQWRYRPEAYWVIVDQFWDKLGLATIAAMVLVVCLSSISCDHTYRTQALILSTKLGRRLLFYQRLIACATGTAVFSIFLSAGNLLCALLLARGIPIPTGWWHVYLGHTLLALTGGALLSISACTLCDKFKSQLAAFAMVGFILLVSAMSPDINGTPTLWYCVANGFFVKLIRGRALTGWSSYSPGWGGAWPGWTLWHLLLATLCIFLAVRKRKERNQW